MLVLSRRPGERIVIDGDIIVEILEILGNRVRLGITAPADVPVDREEIHVQRVRWQQPAAAAEPERAA